MAGQQPQGYPPPGNDPNGQQPYGQPPQGHPQGAPQAGYDPNAPFGYDRQGRPYSDKQKLVAGLLQILLGGFAVGRFYIGDNKTAIWQLVVTWITCGMGALWPLIDGIMMLTSDDICDANGRPLRPN
ncbi:MAG: TM2 domain-containing protein [Planctomycetota bacterium]|jgi:hypothetical protein